MRAPTSEQIRAAARIVATTTVVGHAEPGAGDAFRLTITALHERAERVQKAEEYEAAHGAADRVIAQIIADHVDGTPDDYPDDYLDAARAIREHYAQADDAELAPPPANATIPADATGLKGRKARIVGAPGPTFNPSEPVTIVSDSPSKVGKLFVTGTHHGHGGDTDWWIAVSSLALIPDEPEPCFCGLPDGPGVTHRAGGPCYVDEPEAVPEPPVGTRLRDKDGDVWWKREEGRWFCAPRQDSRFLTGRELRDVIRDFGPLHQVWESWADVPEWVPVTGLDGMERQGCTDQCAACAIDGHAHACHAPFVAVTPYREADQ